MTNVNVVAEGDLLTIKVDLTASRVSAPSYP